jgi:hypothetical protein
MDSKVFFTGHMAYRCYCWKGLGNAGVFEEVVVRVYTLKTLYVTLVHPKLKYVSYVWWPFYGTHIDRIERVQKKLANK